MRQTRMECLSRIHGIRSTRRRFRDHSAMCCRGVYGVLVFTMYHMMVSSFRAKATLAFIGEWTFLILQMITVF